MLKLETSGSFIPISNVWLGGSTPRVLAANILVPEPHSPRAMSVSGGMQVLSCSHVANACQTRKQGSESGSCMAIDTFGRVRNDSRKTLFT